MGSAVRTPDWIVKELRGVRELCAPHPVPSQLPSLLKAEERDVLVRWVRDDNLTRRRNALMQSARPAGLEQAEALCEWLLDEGWITRRERLSGGAWLWESVTWRDLDRLKQLLGVSSARTRTQERESLLEAARAWLEGRREAAVLDAQLLHELAAALEDLVQVTAPVERLRSRVTLIEAVATWCEGGRDGTRRDFALHARGETKALTAAEWQWLASAFDLERLAIAPFAPTLALAGPLGLHWGSRRIDLGAVQFLSLPLADVRRIDRITVETPGAIRYWLIENRASFERQASASHPGVLPVWLPGRPSTAWLHALDHLLGLLPAPAWISADADPAGVEIACTAGQSWEAHGLEWTPHRMGAEELQASAQTWRLNEHDRPLIDRLLARESLPAPLRALCEAMRETGRKAEQEAWL